MLRPGFGDFSTAPDHRQSSITRAISGQVGA
jgi:hypothetical protein